MEIYRIIELVWQGRRLAVVQYTDMGVIVYDRLKTTHVNLGVMGDIQQQTPDLALLEWLPEYYG